MGEGGDGEGEEGTGGELEEKYKCDIKVVKEQM